ncbi:MAG: hypothetical protein JXQ29_08145 [Planctomycetes bacterium]|nr:hypothetical protein [Planctomycetota bacterium]
MRTTPRLAAPLLGALLLVSSAVSTSQEAPFLSHGSVGEDSVTITVRGTPGAHCVLVWGVFEGRTMFHLPENLGGAVALDIAPTWLFASTLDGSIAFNAEGVWTFKIPCLPLIRMLVDRLHFQAVSFHPSGSQLKSATSVRLDLEISRPVSPRSGLLEAPGTSRAGDLPAQRALPASRQQPSVWSERRVTSSQAAYRYDPFGNRVLEPRISTR